MFTPGKKICFAVLTILLLIAAGFFSFNVRTMVVIPQSSDVMGTRSKQFFWAKKYCWDEVYSKAQGNDRFFLQLNTGDSYPKNILQCYKFLHEAEPKNQVYLAYYAIYLTGARTKEAQSDFLKLIDRWKELDPNNGMPYFLKAYYYTRLAISEKKDSPEPHNIKDQAAADLAVLEYQAGLSRKYAACYTDLAMKKKLGSANLEQDPLGTMQRISILASCIPLPLLSLERNLAVNMAFLAEKFWEREKKAEARNLLETGKKYINLRLQNESPALINLLMFHSISNVWLHTARKLKDSSMIPVYDGVAKDFDSWRNRNLPNPEQLKRLGGTFTQIIAPAAKVNIPEQDYKPERMINYLIIDQYGLTSLYLQMVILIAILALVTGVFYLCRRKAQWLQLPAKSCWVLVIAGILLPLAVQIIWTHTDVLSGRTVHYALNQQNLSWLAKYQMLISPLYFGVLCCILLVKKCTAKPLDCIWNLILPLAVYLFLTIGILRPLQDAEIRYYSGQEKLICSERGFSALEDQAIRELTGALKKNLKE